MGRIPANGNFQATKDKKQMQFGPVICGMVAPAEGNVCVCVLKNLKSLFIMNVDKQNAVIGDMIRRSNYRLLAILGASMSFLQAFTGIKVQH